MVEIILNYIKKLKYHFDSNQQLGYTVGIWKSHINILTNSFQGNFQPLKELDAEFCRSLLAENLGLNFSAAGSFFRLYMRGSLSKIAAVWIPLQAVVPGAENVLVVFSPVSV